MKIPKGKLSVTENSGDGKRMFIGHSANDDWEDLRIEIDTDDVDSSYAKAMAKELIRRWNSFEE